MVGFPAQGLVGLMFQLVGAELALFLSLDLFSLSALVWRPRHISSTGSGSRAKVCFFGSGFRVGVCLLGSGLRAKVFLSLALVSWPRWASFTSSGFRVRVGFFG